jgi:indole-3-glycerol phosphate synthase
MRRLGRLSLGTMNAPVGILDRIVETKRREVEALKGRASELRAAAEGAATARDFKAALSGGDSVSVIAEIKRRSPGAGGIRPDLDPVQLAPTYEAGGAAALSVLTDGEYFGGRLGDLSVARGLVSVPVLRKDFLIDPSQVYQARAADADAILLIVRILDDGQLRSLRVLAEELGMTALVEAHDGEEVDRALESGARVLGVNNRNLRTFETRLDTTLGLLDRIPSGVVLVSESGIRTRDDVRMLGENGIDAVLVGESLLRQDDPGAGVAMLAAETRASRREGSR